MQEILFKDISHLAAEMFFKYISYLELLCSSEQTHLSNFGKVHHDRQFCGIISNLDKWFRRFHLKTFYI